MAKTKTLCKVCDQKIHYNDKAEAWLHDRNNTYDNENLDHFAER